MLSLSRSLLFSALALISFGGTAAATPCDKSDIRCAQLVQWAQDYPFVNDRQNSSYLFVSGGVYPIKSFDPALHSATVKVPGEQQAMPVSRLLRLLRENKSNRKRTPMDPMPPLGCSPISSLGFMAPIRSTTAPW